MVECGADDAVGALSRTLFETFLNGTYVLLGREEAAEVMGRSYIHEVHQLQVALNQRGKQDKPDEAEKLHISRYDEQDGLVERVDRLLADHDERYRGWVPEMHRRHYKVLSFQDAHGSLGCLRGYVDIDNPPERVSATRGEPTTAVFLLHHAIADVGSFAGLWGMKVGEDLSALHAALERWEQTQPDAWDPVPSD